MRIAVFDLEDVEVKQVANEPAMFTGWATRPVVDLDNEIVNPKGVRNLQQYLRNPVITWMHKLDVPIGKVLQAEVRDDGILITGQLSMTEKAREIATLLRDGVVRALSIGFIPRKGSITKDGIWVHEEWDWLETALVSVPANPEALITTVKGIIEARGVKSAYYTVNTSTLTVPVRTKPSTPFADLPAHPDLDREWDADASEARWRRHFEIEGREDLENEQKRNNYRKRFFWWNPPGRNFGDYKLPFADIVDGEPRAIWRGVAAAMAALLGARGGVDIPEDERRAVYNHIVRYYEKFDKEPPEFRQYDELELRQIELFGNVVKSANDEVVRLLDSYIGQVHELLDNLKRLRAAFVKSPLDDEGVQQLLKTLKEVKEVLS